MLECTAPPQLLQRFVGIFVPRLQDMVSTDAACKVTANTLTLHPAQPRGTESETSSPNRPIAEFGVERWEVIAGDG
jgi:hypothetical protein